MPNNQHNIPHHPTLFNLGFRPFFMGASIFAPISIAIWLGIFVGVIPFSSSEITPLQWHAHEMIFGYSFAVIAGFLLTAVKNWTGLQTPHGYPLAGIFLSWVTARILWLFGGTFISVAAFFDMLFVISLIVAISMPIVQKRQWRQLAILSKLILLGVGNAVFYLDVFGMVHQTIHMVLYSGVYLVIGLILTMGRRVIPMFIEGGVSEDVTLFNSTILDRSSLLFFLVFFISAVFVDMPLLAKGAAAALFIITTARIIGWYTPGIWRSPLLWCFAVSLLSIDLGFLLYALEGPLSISPYLSIHAFAVGGIGVITMGMMARVSIGHTGRKISAPPRLLWLSLFLLGITLVLRVICPLIFQSSHDYWIELSSIFWITSYLLFCCHFVPIWFSPRVDNKYG